MKLLVVKVLAALMLLFAGLVLPAAADDYSYANRPLVAFPHPRGDVIHVSPFPMSKRAAAVWAADSCWRECTTLCGQRMTACVNFRDADACRPHLQACDLTCQKQCRTRGGPALNITN
jgi:hypothetical protein